MECEARPQERDGRFLDWLHHRARLMGVAGFVELARAAGISPAALLRIEASHSLRGISRTNQSCLARTLRVSLRDLEAIDQGRIGWIDDRHIIDPPALAGNPMSARQLQAADDGAPSCACVAADDEHPGVPIVGAADNWRTVQWDNLHEPRRRLGVRYPKAATAFALRVTTGEESEGRLPAVVFHSVAPVLLRAGERVLITCADGTPTGVTYIGRLVSDAKSMTTRLLPLDTEAPDLEIESESIVRTARWIDRR